MLRETSAKKRETGAKFRKKPQKQKVYHLCPVYGSMRACFCKFIVPTTKNESIFAQCCSQKIGDACIWQSCIVFFALSPCPLLGHHQKTHSRGQEVKPPKEQNTDTKKKQSTARLEVLTPGSDMFCRKEKDKTFAQCLTKKSFCQVHFGYACPWLFALWVCHFFLHEQFSPCSCATDNDRLPFPCPQHAIVGWPQ